MSDEVLHELSLFTGYHGFGLGLRLAGIKTRTVGYCDNDTYIQDLLRQRIHDGLIDDAPIISNVSTFDFSVYRGLVDIITASPPCQPFSVAGNRAGESDKRNLWPDTRRAISEVGPSYVFLENVPGLATAPKFDIKVLEATRQFSLFDQEDKESHSRGINRSNHTVSGYSYMGRIIGDLSEMGYDTSWGIVSAGDVGAPHPRKRWFCVAYKVDDSEHIGLNTTQVSASIG